MPYLPEFRGLVGEWQTISTNGIGAKIQHQTPSVSYPERQKHCYCYPSRQNLVNTGNTRNGQGGSGDPYRINIFASGYESLRAAQLGVSLHGLAGSGGRVFRKRWMLRISLTTFQQHWQYWLINKGSTFHQQSTVKSPILKKQPIRFSQLM